MLAALPMQGFNNALNEYISPKVGCISYKLVKGGKLLKAIIFYKKMGKLELGSQFQSSFFDQFQCYI